MTDTTPGSNGAGLRILVVGAGIAGLGAARALRALGLHSAVAERAAPIPHQRLCDHRGNLLADIDTAVLWGDVGPCLAVHRADLHAVLASHGDPVPVRWVYRSRGSATSTRP